MHSTAEQLEAVIPTLPPKDVGFAESLLSGHRRYGRFSPGQQKWVDILVARGSEDSSVARQDIQLDKTLNPTGVVIRLFQTGKSNLKFPKVRILSPAGKHLLVRLAGEKSKYRGELQVLDQDQQDLSDWGYSKRYYGRIDHEGVFHTSGKCDQDVADAINEFAKDPIQAAKAYGHITGNCCYCGKKLTDARSTEVGYGATCAKNWGQPWGEK